MIKFINLLEKKNIKNEKLYNDALSYRNELEDDYN